MKKNIPLIFSAVIAVVASVARLLCEFIQISDAVKSKVFPIAYAVALLLVFEFAYFSQRKKKLASVSKYGSLALFTKVLCACFMLYTAFSCIKAEIINIPTFPNASQLFSIFVALASIGSAVYFILEAFQRKHSDSFGIMFIFPTAWSTLLLYSFFRKYIAEVIGAYEKMFLLSLSVILIFFLMSARFSYSEEPIPSTYFKAFALLTVAIVPASVIPSFVLSFAGKLVFEYPTVPAVMLAQLAVSLYALVLAYERD